MILSFGLLKAVKRNCCFSASRNTVQIRDGPAAVIGEGVCKELSLSHFRGPPRGEGCRFPMIRESEDLLKKRRREPDGKRNPDKPSVNSAYPGFLF